MATPVALRRDVTVTRHVAAAHRRAAVRTRHVAIRHEASQPVGPIIENGSALDLLHSLQNNEREQEQNVRIDSK
jgi:hypothetical protein